MAWSLNTAKKQQQKTLQVARIEFQCKKTQSSTWKITVIWILCDMTTNPGKCKSSLINSVLEDWFMLSNVMYY